jgi:hypothetical protein
MTCPRPNGARHRESLVWRVWPLALRDGTVSVPGLADSVLEDLASSTDVITGWLPVAGLDAEWSGELVRRFAETAPCAIQPIIRISGTDQVGHVEHQWRILGDAAADGITQDIIWASPAVGAAGALVDEGGIQFPVLDGFVALGRAAATA